MAVARRQRAGLDLELLQRVGKRRRQVQVVERIVVRAAVHDVGDAVGLPAGDRDRRRSESSCWCSGRRAGADVARPDRKISSVAWRPLSGSSIDALVVDHLADAGVLRLRPAMRSRSP